MESMDSIYLAQGRDHSGGFCEYGNEPLVLIKCREFLEWQSNYWLLKYSGQWG
jgi:hypothetical protein